MDIIDKAYSLAPDMLNGYEKIKKKNNLYKIKRFIQTQII
jgi:hypothetical protein